MTEHQNWLDWDQEKRKAEEVSEEYRREHEGGLELSEHKHPHGVNDVEPNLYRIWLCDECEHIFYNDEIRAEPGHVCKCHPVKKGQRCESHLDPFMPEKEV